MKKMILTLLSTSLISCVQTTENFEIKDYSEVDTSISWNEVFSFEGEYLVYFYSEHCAHCKEIKSLVLTYYSEHIETMYFVCTDEYAIFSKGDNLIGMKSIEDFYILGTPFLIRIYEKELVNYYAGSSKISEYIDMKMQKWNNIFEIDIARLMW